MFSNWYAISKINFKNKKNYFNIFPNKKIFLKIITIKTVLQKCINAPKRILPF
jgi:hypothetical protein